MREFGIINIKYWNWVVKNNISDYAIIMGAFLLTCKHCNSLGCFYCPPAYVADDLQNPIETVSKAYGELFEKGFLLYCESTKTVFLKKYLKFNPPQNINHGISILKIAKSLPEDFEFHSQLIESLNKFSNNNLKEENFNSYISAVNSYGIANPIDTVLKPCSNKDKDKDKDINKNTFFNIILKDQTAFTVDYDYIQELKTFFPDIDMNHELNKMAAWSAANEKKRKTKKGIKRFINNWLSTAADDLQKSNKNNNNQSTNYNLLN